MAFQVNHQTRVIYIPQADLTPLGGNLYALDVNQFRLALKDWEDDEGISMPDTHVHYPEVTVAGVTLAHVVVVINGYTVTFEDGQYGVQLTGANNNLSDVTNVNSVSIRSNNSAGLTAAADPQDIADMVFNTVVENNFSLQQMLRLMAAALFGKDDGVGTATIHMRDTADSKNRITATVDGSGNRTAITLDPS